jgi:hypothetical protein
MKLYSKLTLFLSLLIIIACNKGLAPPDKLTGFSGTIYYSNWDSAGTINNLKLVVFKNYPPDDIVSEVLSGDAKAYPAELAQSLPLNIDSTSYTMNIEVGYYEYIAIAQQYGDNLYTDWRAVGQYTSSPQDSLPAPITITDEFVITDINIYVDFNNLPPQPF